LKEAEAQPPQTEDVPPPQASATLAREGGEGKNPGSLAR
jgi:hypothetical protein